MRGGDFRFSKRADAGNFSSHAQKPNDSMSAGLEFAETLAGEPLAEACVGGSLIRSGY